ncbi:type I restriction enzyme HsdR N-terminal domain-containing protein [Sunxiuqinia sp. A32]|uniref:type I restriction enzyme HsdR N-terminal domain-containing protein n=1 Tax=Sunxiuqinia sp. A32 TaxID=3461496 RepID=UPI0040464CE1
MFTKLNLPTYSIRIKEEGGKTLIFDSVRKKFLVYTPEEWVRQNFILFLSKDKAFPASLMAVETGLQVNQKQFRADLLVYDRKGKALLVVEFKAPSVKISQDTFDQIVRYNMKLQVPYLIVSNGLNHYCCQVDLQNQSYVFLKEIPDFSQIG